MQLPNVTQPGIWRQTKYNSEREREKQGGQVGYFIAILFVPVGYFWVLWGMEKRTSLWAYLLSGPHRDIFRFGWDIFRFL